MTLATMIIFPECFLFLLPNISFGVKTVMTTGVRTDLHTVDEEDQENEYGSTDDDQQGKRSGQDDDDVILDEEGEKEGGTDSIRKTGIQLYFSVCSVFVRRSLLHSLWGLTFELSVLIVFFPKQPCFFSVFFFPSLVGVSPLSQTIRHHLVVMN